MKSDVSKVIIVVVIATLLLLVGLGIYIFFRKPIIFFEVIGCKSMVPVVYLNVRNPLIYFLLFCVPDALWYMSLLLLQTLFYSEKGRLSNLLRNCAMVLPFLLEVLQCFGIILGTFDWYDILTYCLTLILFLCLKKLFLPLYYKS